uniref:Uncharacterized protein n=1 Tax=Oryza glumipatula TaxID=40148 RepID=A0A0E0AVN6_9ORYZ
MHRIAYGAKGSGAAKGPSFFFPALSPPWPSSPPVLPPVVGIFEPSRRPHPRERPPPHDHLLPVPAIGAAAAVAGAAAASPGVGAGPGRSFWVSPRRRRPWRRPGKRGRGKGERERGGRGKEEDVSGSHNTLFV